MTKFEKPNNLEKTISEFEDLRALDLSNYDLKNIPLEILNTTQFNTQTIWPKIENLPENFDPKKLLEESKNPGLGVLELHNQGINGQGVRVAIIDQKLDINHLEYKDVIKGYSEYGNAGDESISMHGPAVASLLVGKTCGVAPGAELIYKAVPSGRSFAYEAQALEDIIKENQKSNKKIRIVSCSIGYMIENPEPGLDEWIEAIKKTTDSGIVVVDVGTRLGMEFTGGGSIDKENFDEYSLWLNYKSRINIKHPDIKPEHYDQLPIIIPSDHRTFASSWQKLGGYEYNGKGGISWSVPYLAGIFTMALQINPNLTQEELVNLVIDNTHINKNGLKIINPKKIIQAIKK